MNGLLEDLAESPPRSPATTARIVAALKPRASVRHSIALGGAAAATIANAIAVFSTPTITVASLMTVAAAQQIGRTVLRIRRLARDGVVVPGTIEVDEGMMNILRFELDGVVMSGKHSRDVARAPVSGPCSVLALPAGRSRSVYVVSWPHPVRFRTGPLPIPRAQLLR